MVKNKKKGTSWRSWFKRLGLTLLSLIVVGITTLVIMFPDELDRVFESYATSFSPQDLSKCEYSDPSTKRDAAFSKQIDSAKSALVELKEKYLIPGIAVCVSIDNKVIWNEGIGCENIEMGKPITTDTRFRIGSISKSITAIGLMSLVQKGSIDLSDPAIEYLPNLGFAEDLTIRALANHQSGIRHYQGLEMLSNYHYRSIEESLSIFVDDPLESNPGEAFLYSTYNYNIISRLIEEVSGENFLDYTKRMVLNRLGMNHTVHDLPVFGYVGYSSGLKASKIRPAIGVDLSNKWAGGGYLSTPKDLVYMIDNLPAILNDKARAEMYKDNTLRNGSKTEYGIGFRITYLDNYQFTLIHHGGSSIGGRAYLVHIPEARLTIALCANNDGGFNPSNHFGIQEVFDLAKNFIDEE